jgi:PAS domain S-box-containing protein
MPRFSLLVKLLLAFGIVLLPVLALLITGFQSNLAWRETTILESQQLTAEAVAVQVDGAFDSAIGLAWAIANDPLTQTLDQNRLDPHLKQLMERYPLYHAIGVFDVHGVNRGYGHLSLSSEPRFSIADMTYFQSVMATNTPVISQVIQLKRPAGMVGVVAAVPIRNETSQMIGVVTVVMAADQLAKRYEETRLLPGQAILLVDRTTRLAFHSLKRNLSYSASAAYETLPPLRAALAGTPTTVSEFSDPLTSDVRIGAFVPTLRHRWVVGVTMPPAVALAPAYRQLREQLWAFVGILLLSAGLVSLLARYIVRPFLRLKEAAVELGRGNLARRVDIRTGDEIEALSASFNEMAGQLQQRDKALRDGEARIRRLVESNIIGVFFWELRGGIVDANDAFLHILGYSREELRSGKIDWSDLTPPEYRPRDQQAIEDLLRTGSCTPYDKEYVKKNGDRVPVLLGGALLEGSREAGVAFVIDLTERKRAEAELKRHRDHLDELVKGRTAELSVAKEAAEAANRAKNAFLANISHEFRTPLNAILGYAQILKRDKGLSERDALGLNIIRQSGDHLLTLVTDILDLAKVEAGKLDLYPSVFNLPGFLRLIADTIRIKADEKGLQFLYEPSPDLPQAVQADHKRLRQILLNLLGNAVKFTDRGQVTLRVLAIPGDEPFSRVRFEVHDTGIGIAEKQLRALFQPFEQAGDAHRRSFGAGLGLAISRQLARLMGSDIHVESELGRGSHFWFELDLPRIDGVIDSPVVEQMVIGYQGPRKKVLIADDIAANRALVVELLGRLGFHTMEAVNGYEALETAKRLYPDMIIIDIQMPEMDGLEATRQLRELPAFKETTIIVVSASVSNGDKAESLGAGANLFLPKPLDFNVLLQQIGIALQLVWIYERQEERPIVANETSSDLVAPPAEEMDFLHGLALAGNMRDILEWTDRLETVDARYAPFAEKLRRLAKNFQSKAILALVQEFRVRR